VKKGKRRVKRYKNPLLYTIVLCLFVLAITYSYKTNDRIEAFDFSERAEGASVMKLAGEHDDQSSKEQKTNEATESADENTQQDVRQEQEQSTAEERQENQLNEKSSESKPSSSKAANQKPTNQSNQGQGNRPSSQSDQQQSDAIEIVEQADEQNRYFTTNLTNNETVTEPVYYVTITHLDDTLKVEQLDVHLNGSLLKEFDGELHFIDGENEITFSVTYKKEDGKLISVRQTYTITLNTKDIIIFTNLKNETINEEELTFTAQAKKGKEKADLTVTLNNTKLKPLGGSAYKANLQEGENVITLTASLDGGEAEEIFTVVYEKTKSVISLNTDLKDQRASSPEYSFYVNATAEGKPIELTVLLNDKAIEPINEDNYKVQLQHGTNIIKVEGEFKQEKLAKQYKILYKDPNVQEEEKVDPEAPKLITDLKSGITVKGNIKTINVWPTTATGERIRGKNVLVKVNGTGVPFTWDDSTKTSYKLVLQEGENKVSIKVWDNDGRAITEDFIVNSEGVEDNGVIGQVTISLEASTLGIDYLIPPKKMDIHKGEKGSYILDQFLRNNGFTYNHTGTLDTNFYLKAVNKHGMLNQINISDDLWALVEQSSTRASKEDYSPDSLGEFDFANGAGWMYSVNGDYPNYGFSDAYFLDGDVVRIRFTLHYGKDIKGFGGMGSSSGPDWDKEW